MRMMGVRIMLTCGGKARAWQRQSSLSRLRTHGQLPILQEFYQPYECVHLYVQC